MRTSVTGKHSFVADAELNMFANNWALTLTFALPSDSPALCGVRCLIKIDVVDPPSFIVIQQPQLHLVL